MGGLKHKFEYTVKRLGADGCSIVFLPYKEGGLVQYQYKWRNWGSIYVTAYDRKAMTSFMSLVNEVADESTNIEEFLTKLATYTT